MKYEIKNFLEYSDYKTKSGNRVCAPKGGLKMRLRIKIKWASALFGAAILTFIPAFSLQAAGQAGIDIPIDISDGEPAGETVPVEIYT